jgi:selenocysteine lyase/cysteine desulfurase
VRQFKERHIVAATRSGWVRTSPHFYISPEEIDRMIAELP